MSQETLFPEAKPKIAQKPKSVKQKKKKQENSLKNLVLLAEFERFCIDILGEFKKEVRLWEHLGFEYRADYFFPRFNLIIEINGGQFSDGGHTSGRKDKIEGGKLIKFKNPKTNRMIGKRVGGHVVTHYESDIRKANLAQIEGYIYLQYTYQQLERQEYKKQLTKVFQNSKK